MQAIFHYCFSIFIRFIQLRSIVPECSLRLFVILVSRLLLQDQICCGFLTWDCYLGHIPLSNKTNSGNADGLSFHLQNDSWLSAWPLVHTHQTNLLSRRQHNTTMLAKKSHVCFGQFTTNVFVKHLLGHSYFWQPTVIRKVFSSWSPHSF